jgi:hypothetical protein
MSGRGVNAPQPANGAFILGGGEPGFTPPLLLSLPTSLGKWPGGCAKG